MMLGARTAAWAKSGAPLPYDAEVEWIDNTEDKNAFIDLGLRASSKDEWRLGFGVREKHPDELFWGAANDNSRTATAWSTLGGAVRFGGSKTYSFPYDRWYYNFIRNDLIVKEGVITLNGLSVEHPQAIFNDSLSTDNVFIGRCNNDRRIIGCRIFYIKLIVNGIYKLDLHPVSKDGVAFLHNRIDDSMLGNSGTGSFVIGPIKTT